MRLMIGVAAALLIAAPAFAQPYGRDPLPRSERALQRLNNEQLRILRRASHICTQSAAAVPIRAERNPCVIMSTDKAIEDSEDPGLIAFHYALPDNERYDEYRTDTTWRAFLVEYPDY
jgi:hypothetical protein